MGLFDIFKRRNKKDQEKPAEQSETTTDNEDLTNSEKQVADSDSTNEVDNNSEATDNNQASDDSQPLDTDTVSKEEIENPKTPDSFSEAASEPENKPKPEEESISEPVANDTNDESLASVEKNGSETQEDSATQVETSNPLEETNQEASTATTTEPSDESTLENVAAPQEDKNDESTQAASKDTDETAEEQNADDDIYERGLARSRSTFGQKLNALFANFRSVDESFFTNLEDMLIESDVGFETAMQITDELRDEVKLKNVKKTKEVQNVVIKKMIDIYDAAGDNESIEINFADQGPTVILFVGVNGVGKTTTIGKMAQMYKDQGQKVLLAAADTFRAGAIAQLNVWAERDGVDIVKGKEQGDPAAVVYDAVKKAKAENYDILMVDTAGRLQNKVNLMNELAKMKKVITREIPDAPHETLLVLDGTTGQNALNQAKMFKDTTDVSGIVLTKLDGTAKGGIVFAIRNELHLPVKYVGLGEKVTDLQVFDANEFVYGLFKGLIS